MTTDLLLFQTVKKKLGKKEAEALVSFVGSRIRDSNEASTMTWATKKNLVHLSGHVDGQFNAHSRRFPHRLHICYGLMANQ